MPATLATVKVLHIYIYICTVYILSQSSSAGFVACCFIVFYINISPMGVKSIRGCKVLLASLSYVTLEKKDTRVKDTLIAF